MTITTVGIDLAKNVLLFTALTKMVKLFWLNPRCRVQHFLNSSQVYLPVSLEWKPARVPTIGQDYSGSMAMMSG